MTTIRSVSNGHVTVALDRSPQRTPVRVSHPVGSVQDTCLWMGGHDEEVVAVLCCSEAIAIGDALRAAAGAPNHHDAGYRKGVQAGEDLRRTQYQRYIQDLEEVNALLREKDAEIADLRRQWRDETEDLHLTITALTDELNEGPWSL